MEKHGDLERGRISCHISRAVYVINCLGSFTSAGLDKSLATSQTADQIAIQTADKTADQTADQIADQITIHLLNRFHKYFMNVNRRLHLLINDLAEV